MHTQQELLENHLNHMDDFLSLNTFTDNTLVEWLTPISRSVTMDGAISYLIDNPKRYRASPLASTIIWLDRANLLPPILLSKMQDALLHLKDNNYTYDEENGNLYKKPEDGDAWSLGEGASIWSTSMAILALLDSHNCGIKKASFFKQSIIWLASQRNVEQKGWAYQNHSNCSVNVIMSALAVRALSGVYSETNRKYFSFTDSEMQTIKAAIIGGSEYLQHTCNFKNKIAYWTFRNNPHCTATAWALLALHDASTIDGLLSKDIQDFFTQVLPRGLKFILNQLPKKEQKWGEEQIVEETGAKYQKQKNYYSFLSTLIPQLFVLGVSPFHPKIICQIRWLINHKDEWKSKYDNTYVCTFTHAMLVSTIVIWTQKVGNICAKNLMAKNKKTHVSKTILGYSLFPDTPMVLIYKPRIAIFAFLVVFFHILIFSWKYTSSWVSGLFEAISEHFPRSTVISASNTILLNIVSSLIYAAIVSAFWFIFDLLRRKGRIKKKE